VSDCCRGTAIIKKCHDRQYKAIMEARKCDCETGFLHYPCCAVIKKVVTTHSTEYPIFRLMLSCANHLCQDRDRPIA
jgi:hypothetical protein